MPSTLENTFHSLRQYLECNSGFGYTSRLLMHFRLSCSFANLFQQNFHFSYCSLDASAQPQSCKVRANTISFQHLHRLVSPAEALRLTRISQNTNFRRRDLLRLFGKKCFCCKGLQQIVYEELYCVEQYVKYDRNNRNW